MTNTKTFTLPDNRTATLTVCPPEYSAYMRALEKRVEVLTEDRLRLAVAAVRGVPVRDIIASINRREGRTVLEGGE
jgi:hypothetical protein